MKHLFLLQTTRSAPFHYRIQLIKIPSAFRLRRIFNHLIGAVALAALAAAATASAAESTIPIIVKDTTSGFWQIVLAGARKAGKDLGVKVPELGAQSEADINGQVSILENAVSEKSAAIVIAPTQFSALGKPIDEAAKKCIIRSEERRVG